jgi:hypothetical protein
VDIRGSESLSVKSFIEFKDFENTANLCTHVHCSVDIPKDNELNFSTLSREKCCVTIGLKQASHCHQYLTFVLNSQS